MRKVASTHKFIDLTRKKQKKKKLKEVKEVMCNKKLFIKIVDVSILIKMYSYIVIDNPSNY